MLDRLKRSGVEIHAEGDRLKVVGLSALPPDHAEEARAWIRDHKPELLAQFGPDASKMSLNQRRWLPGHCRACGGTTYWINAGGARVCSVCHPPAHSRAFFIHSEQKTA